MNAEKFSTLTLLPTYNMKDEHQTLNVFFEDELFSMIGIDFLKFLKELVARKECARIKDFLFDDGITNSAEQGDAVANYAGQSALQFSKRIDLAQTPPDNRRKPAKTLVTGDKISKVMKYTEMHYGKAINVREAAGIAGLSEDAFSRFFRKMAGVCFTGYVNGIRVGEAARLLCETDEPVMEIGYITGFSASSYFNKVFKQNRGMTPGEFRKLYGGTGSNL